MNGKLDISEASGLIMELKRFSSMTRLRNIEFKGRCPYCGMESHTDYFRQHAYRLRIFYVIFSGLVYKINAALPRWRCHLCNRTFTEYPNYILPQKRYTLPQIKTLIVNTTRTSYRRTVMIDAVPIFHNHEVVETVDHIDENESLPILSHTSLYRWKRFFTPS
jgi:transposase-like protein